MLIMDKYILVNFACLFLVTRPDISRSQGITSCVYNVSTCTCETNLGTIYLILATQNTPYEADSLAQDKYYWQPCTDFTMQGVTAGAMQVVSSGDVYNLGVHYLAWSTAEDGYAMFNMYSDNTRMTFVKCICGSSTSFVFTEESPIMNYHFALTSSYCCPGYSGNTSITISLSVGSILVILFFAVIILYFVGGTIYMVGVKKAQGRERVPNINFWTAIPVLIKDGFIFTATRGRKQGYTKM